jgi:hypothetical protein
MAPIGSEMSHSRPTRISCAFLFGGQVNVIMVADEMELEFLSSANMLHELDGSD